MMKHRFYFTTVILLSVVIYLFAESRESKTLTETLGESDSYSIFYAAVQATGLEDLLNEQNLTLFVPSNQAFKNLTRESKQSLFHPQHTSLLRIVILNHIVAGTFDKELVSVHPQLKAINGKYLNISNTKEGIEVNTITLSETNKSASNGVIHRIDEVIVFNHVSGNEYESCPYLQGKTPSECPVTGKSKQAEFKRGKQI